jgi:hypothetical protein
MTLFILDYYGVLARHNKTFKTGFKDKNLFVPHDLIKDVECRIKNFLSRNPSKKQMFAICSGIYFFLIKQASHVFDSNSFLFDTAGLANHFGLEETQVKDAVEILNEAQCVFSQYVVTRMEESLNF